MSSDYRILVAVDLKTGTDRLLAEVQRYAKALDAIVDIVHVAPPDPDFVGYIKSGRPDDQTATDPMREPTAEALRAEHQQIQALGTTLRSNGVNVDRARALQGPHLSIILEEARKLSADLLIIGSHHHGTIYRFWHGDTVAEISTQAPCALLVVPV